MFFYDNPPEAALNGAFISGSWPEHGSERAET